jgi:hypothetical protein
MTLWLTAQVEVSPVASCSLLLLPCALLGSLPYKPNSNSLVRGALMSWDPQEKCGNPEHHNSERVVWCQDVSHLQRDGDTFRFRSLRNSSGNGAWLPSQQVVGSTANAGSLACHGSLSRMIVRTTPIPAPEWRYLNTNPCHTHWMKSSKCKRNTFDSAKPLTPCSFFLSFSLGTPDF